MEYKRTITKSDDENIIKTSKVRFTFNDQKLLDLWNNELCGQLSDGAWENTSGAEWLWKNNSAILGKENKLEIDNQWMVKRKNYPFFKELFKIVGDRMIIENGFKDKEELQKACQIIQDTIKNYSVNYDLSKEIDKENNRIKLEKENRIKSYVERLEGYIFKKDYDWDDYYIELNNFKIEILSVSEKNIITIKISGQDFNYTKFNMNIKVNYFHEVLKNLINLSTFNQRG